MANTQVEDLANTIMKASLFGRNVDIEFETAETERKEKGRKIKLEKMRREEEMRKEEEERKRLKLEELMYAMEENERTNTEFQQLHFPQRLKTGRGRAALSREMLAFQRSPMKGRGRLSVYDQQASFFEREQSVKRQINQFSDGMYQNNHFQKQVWLQDAPTTSLGSSGNASPLQEDGFLEQFEDARSSPRLSAFDSPHSESASFVSFASSNSTNSSPIPAPTEAIIATVPPAPAIEEKEKPQIVPQVSRGAIRKTRSRIAAKFDFGCENERPEDVKVDEKENAELKPINYSNKVQEKQQIYDPVAVLTSHDRRSAPTRIRVGPESISINDLRFSQRILSKGLLRPEEIMSNPYHKSNDFTYNKNDFPSL